MAEAVDYTNVAREIYDTHDVKRRYQVAHHSGPKLFSVAPNSTSLDGGFTISNKDGYDMPLDEFIGALNEFEPDETQRLEVNLTIDAISHLWDVRCTVRAN